MTDNAELLEIETVDLQAVEWRVFRDAVALSERTQHRPLSSVDDLYPIVGVHSTAKNRASVISPLARKGLLTEFRSDGFRAGGAKSWTVVFSKAVRCAGRLMYRPVPGCEVGEVIVSEATSGVAPTSAPTGVSGVFPEVHLRLYRNGSETERPRVNLVPHVLAMEVFGEYFSGTTKGGVVRDFLRTLRMTRDGDDFLVLEPEAWEARQGEAAHSVVATEIPKKKMSDMWRVFWDAAPSEASNGERLCSREHALQMLADNGFQGKRLASMLGALVTHKAVHWLDDTRMTLVIREPDGPPAVVSVTRVPDAPAPTTPALKSRVELEEDFDLVNAALVAGEADRCKAQVALAAAHAEVRRLEGELLNLPGLGELRAKGTALRQLIDNYDLLVKA